ncbi:MAG: 4-hydroxy-tetrahydrodipicolinate reductase, partial [Synechococcales cyanobacterium]
MTIQTKIPVVVNGAAGNMGREVIKAIAATNDLTVVGALDQNPDVQGL